jgi:hypothetical protein
MVAPLAKGTGVRSSRQAVHGDTLLGQELVHAGNVLPVIAGPIIARFSKAKSGDRCDPLIGLEFLPCRECVLLLDLLGFRVFGYKLSFEGFLHRVGSYALSA